MFMARLNHKFAQKELAMIVKKIEKPEWFHVKLPTGSDLFQGLRDFLDEQKLSRAYVLTTIGSMTKAICNYPVGDKMPPEVRNKKYEQLLEINGIAGEVWREDGNIRVHLHGSLTHEADTVYGGGLADGARVLMQAEMVIMGLKEI